MQTFVAIVGCPNVGKSTLFNRLTHTQRALVGDLPGVTRDRFYGQVEVEDQSFTLVDTGGFDPSPNQTLDHNVYAQIKLALDQADIFLFVADGKTGLSPIDQEIVRLLRRTSKPIIYAINKIDNLSQQNAAQEFQSLGVKNLHFISAAHGQGVRSLTENILNFLPPSSLWRKWEEKTDENKETIIRVTLLGRPNVGKSTLLNTLIGENRMIVSDLPGTTRDAIDTPFKKGNQEYLLVDTAGIRRQGRIKHSLETAGVLRSLRAIERCHIVILVVDSSEGATDQDLHLAGQAIQNHRGLIVALNKWDLLANAPNPLKQLCKQKNKIERFAPWAPIIYLSAKTGKGLNQLLPWTNKVWTDYGKRLTTAPLNEILRTILIHQSPPMFNGQRPKFYYASQVSIRPPTIVLFVNNPKAIHFSYKRYLLNKLRQFLCLRYSPLVLIFRPNSER